MSDSPRRIGDVTRAEALSLLAGVSLGRFVFTENAMPAVRPASHLVEAGAIIARSHDGSRVVAGGDGGRAPGSGLDQGAGLGQGTGRAQGPERETVVAYQADEIDVDARLGWSVVVTGPARPVLDPEEVERYGSILSPWTDAGEGQLIRVHPGIVAGYRLIDQTA